MMKRPIMKKPKLIRYCGWCACELTKESYKETICDEGLCLDCTRLKFILSIRDNLLGKLAEIEEDIKNTHNKIIAKRKDHTPILTGVKLA